MGQDASQARRWTILAERAISIVLRLDAIAYLSRPRAIFHRPATITAMLERLSRLLQMMLELVHFGVGNRYLCLSLECGTR